MLVGYDLVQATGGSERAIGFAVIIVAGIGIVLAFLPPVSRAIEPTA
ncbi:MAG: hypothetical protein PSX37_09230 [bacterium]|nr:hypothetical protein [bacterium]